MLTEPCDACGNYVADMVYPGRRVDYMTGELFGKVREMLYLCRQCWRHTTWLGDDRTPDEGGDE